MELPDYPASLWLDGETNADAAILGGFTGLAPAGALHRAAVGEPAASCGRGGGR